MKKEKRSNSQPNAKPTKVNQEMNQDKADQDKLENQIEVVSLEALDEATEVLNREQDADGLIKTKYTDGSTTNPADAQEQGLVYTPPSDPPVVPSDNAQGVEVATGFASSMEESNPSAERFPARIDNNDLDLESDIATALRLNSETQNLDDVTVKVYNGVAYLRGDVESVEDVAIVGYLVRDLEGVVDIINELSVR